MSISRRHLLAVLSATSLAGCTNSISLGSSDETGISLGSLFVHNPDEEPESVQLQLEREDEIVYGGEVEAASVSERIDPTWSTEPAEYTLLWATDDEMGAASIPEDFDREDDSADCYHAMFNFYGPASPVVELLDSEESDKGTC